MIELPMQNKKRMVAVSRGHDRTACRYSSGVPEGLRCEGTLAISGGNGRPPVAVPAWGRTGEAVNGFVRANVARQKLS